MKRLFENLVVSEMMKRVKNADSGEDLFFFRTSDGIEVDVLVRTDNGFRPVEIKSAMTYSVALESGLRRFLELQPQSLSPTVVYGGRSMSAGENEKSIFPLRRGYSSGMIDALNLPDA